MDDDSDDAPPPVPPDPIPPDAVPEPPSGPPDADADPSDEDRPPPPPPDPIGGAADSGSTEAPAIDLGRSTWTGWDDEVDDRAPAPGSGIDLGRSTWTGWDDDPDGAGESQPGEAGESQPADGGDDDAPPPPDEPIMSASPPGVPLSAAAAASSPSRAASGGESQPGSGSESQPAEGDDSPFDAQAPQEVGRSGSSSESQPAEGDDSPFDAQAPQEVGRSATGSESQPAEGGKKRRWLWWGSAGVLVLVLVGVAFAVWAWVLWGRVDRVDLSATFAPASGGGTNYLVIGTDSRAGVDPENPNAGVIFGDGTVTGERTDTVVVLRIGGEAGDAMMALPRDLWIPIDGGAEQRINTAFAEGPDALVRTIQGSLDIPIQHYVEVDFAGFLELVDALGGVTIPFEHPAYDTRSGLSVAETGDVRLDADQALAYVRSRAYTEVIDGRDVADPTGDLGRVERQQTFLRAVFDEVGGARNPFTLLGILDSLAGNIRLDDDLGLWDAFGLARQLRGLDPESVELPTFGFTTSGGAAVLGLADGADEALARFR